MYIKVIILAVVTVQNLEENAVTSAGVSRVKKRTKIEIEEVQRPVGDGNILDCTDVSSRLVNSVPELSRHRLQHSSEGY